MERHLHTILACRVTINTCLRSPQYNIPNNVLYLNKKLHTFGLSNTQLCSCCEIEDKTISYIFYCCTQLQHICNQVQAYFTDCLHFSQLTPQFAIFGFHNIDNDTFLIEKVVLSFVLIFLFYTLIYM